MERLFQLVERYCFQGHTHVPGVFTESFQFYAPEEIDNEYTLGDGKLMINVGSVGQPRDGDNRACYVILDDGSAGRRPTAATPIGPPPARSADHLPPPALRLRDDDPEDLRHPRARAVPGRPAPPGTLAVHAAAARSDPADRGPTVPPSDRRPSSPRSTIASRSPGCDGPDRPRSEIQAGRSATRALPTGLQGLLHDE